MVKKKKRKKIKKYKKKKIRKNKKIKTQKSNELIFKVTKKWAKKAYQFTTNQKK